MSVKVPEGMQSNVYGPCYGRYYIAPEGRAADRFGPKIEGDGEQHWYNADRIEIPCDIFDMTVDQGEMAFKGWIEREKQRKVELVEAEKKAKAEEERAEEDAKRRAEQEKEQEIQSRVKETLKAMGIDPSEVARIQRAGAPAHIDEPVDLREEEANDDGSPPTAEPDERYAEGGVLAGLTNIIDSAQSKEDLHARLEKIDHLIIRKAVVAMGQQAKTGTGSKAKNIDILAGELELA
jgi:hypothetical protein